MTSKVNFYLLSGSSHEDACYFACRLVEKALSGGLSVYILMNDHAGCEYMDDLLWSFKPESFIPHMIEDSESDTDDEDIKVLVSEGKTAPAEADIMINLSSRVPDFHNIFSTIAEIVSTDEQDKSSKRERWIHYQSLGYDLNRHSIT